MFASTFRRCVISVSCQRVRSWPCGLRAPRDAGIGTYALRANFIVRIKDAMIDAKVFGVKRLEGAAASIRRGAHTSPIGYPSEGWTPRRQREWYTTQKVEQQACLIDSHVAGPSRC